MEGSSEIILCESLIDALTFWCAGIRNVTAAYGVNGFTSDHWAVLKKYGTRRVRLAYDRDEAGDRAADGLGAELVAAGLSCARVLFPRGMDANEYALKVAPAAEGLQVLLNRAEWMGGAAVAEGTLPDARERSTITTKLLSFPAVAGRLRILDPQQRPMFRDLAGAESRVTGD